MFLLLQITLIVLTLGVFFWMILTDSNSKRTSQASADLPIDPSDSRQIGHLIGMFGGSIEDAAVARYALQRFEEKHGRKATHQDMGLIVGLMRELR